VSEDLPDAVRSALAASFDGAELVRVEAVAGRARMSRTARLAIRDSAGTRSTVFAKWPSRSARVRRMARSSGAYRREVLFYRELAGSRPVRLPRAYACHHDVETDDFVLLLEDFAGARAGDTLTASAADVDRVLRTIATLHARWLDDDRLGSIPWLAAAADPRLQRYPLERIFRAAARGRFRTDPARAVLSLLRGGLPGPAYGRRTLVHGDLHADQALFPAGADSVIVDWQLVRPGTVGLDTARLVTLSLTPEERRRHETSLLATYRRALQERGAPAYDPATCLEDYRRGIVWTAFVNLAACLPAAGETDDFHGVMFDRIAAAATDHGLLPRRV
jgi:aminoglycoside phosphotransferase (APT) family kinase protein